MEHPKCGACKCYWKPEDTDINPSGLYYKSCKKCRTNVMDRLNKTKCEHNRFKSQCKECGGSCFCEHNKRKSECKECGGSSICEHNKIKSRCKECGGSSICEHAIQKSTCKKCGGSSICEHNRTKSKCNECSGGSICEHNKRRTRCKECGGGYVCEHARQKSQCKEWGGSLYCTHKKRKSNCKECNFKQYLINLQRNQIKRCLNDSNLGKIKPFIEYLGCSTEYVIEYFKKKMDKFNLFSEIEMTWDNIHIDHIKPISVFDLVNEDEFLNCCNYTNLQPLIAKVNLNKHYKWNNISNDFWLNIIIDKEYLDIYIPSIRFYSLKSSPAINKFLLLTYKSCVHN